MNRIENMLPHAVSAVQTEIANQRGIVDSAFNGYISSFGASITMAGLLPSVIFFSEKGGSQADRPAVIRGVVYILQQTGDLRNNEILTDKLLALARSNNNAEMARIEELVTDAAVALKLAIRTFPKK